MKTFINDDFLLKSEAARILYHEHAEKMPIFDYHCHLNPQEIYEDVRFDDIAHAWLGGDHYKWRVMRANAVPERFVTGDAPGREKFDRYAEVMPRLIGNPIYHWSRLELLRFFGVVDALPEDLAPVRRAVVETACSLVGKVNYWWGGKSLTLGWDDRWGSLRKVTADGSVTSGQYRPYGLDCSGCATRS